MSTPEGLVKKHIVAELTQLKKEGNPIWWFFPVGGRFGKSGVPDITGVIDKRFFAIEVKAAGGKTTALQDKAIAEIISAGGKACVIAPHPCKTIKEQVYEFIYE